MVGLEKALEKVLEKAAEETMAGVKSIYISTFSVLLFAACAPTVKVATDEPITINLNVNIQHEVRVKVDRELEDVLSEESGLF